MNGLRRGGHVRKVAMAYALGGLRPTERARVERHRRACPECDRLLDGHERAVARLPSVVRATPPPSPAVKAALLARVARAQAARERRATARRFAFAAVILASGSVLLHGDGGPLPSPTPIPLTVVASDVRLFGIGAGEETVRLVRLDFNGPPEAALAVSSRVD